MINRFHAAVFALSFCSLGIYAFEWGGKVDNTTKFYGNKTSDLKLNQKDSFALWMNTPLNRSNSASLSAQAHYGFEYDKDSDKFTNICDIDLLKVSLLKKTDSGSTFRLNAGRFGFSDFSGLIFSQNADGIFMKYSAEKVSVSAFGAYTGLLNAQSVSMIDIHNKNTTLDDCYSFCDKYIPYGLTLQLPSLFSNQNLSVQATGFSDLNDSPINRYYATAALNGYIVPKVNYVMVTTFGTKDFENVSNLTTADFTVYPAGFFAVSLDGLYATGNRGSFDSFTGFTSMTAYEALSEPEYTDLAKFDLKAKFSILNQAVLSGGASLVFDGGFTYKGFQWQAGAFWNILEDFQLGADAVQFYGDNSNENKTSFTVKAVLNF